MIRFHHFIFEDFWAYVEPLLLMIIFLTRQHHSSFHLRSLWALFHHAFLVLDVGSYSVIGVHHIGCLNSMTTGTSGNCSNSGSRRYNTFILVLSRLLGEVVDFVLEHTLPLPHGL